MNKRTLVPVIIALIIVAGAAILVTRRSGETREALPEQANTRPTSTIVEDSSQPPVATAPAPAQSAQPTVTQPAEVTGHFSGESDVEGSDVQVFNIVYDGSVFTPSTLSLKSGDIVIFKNKSKVAFRPASDPHPTHTDYPEFDAKQSVAAGKSYQFKFTRVGTWKYHDHLNPSAKGSITVTQ